MNVHQTLSASVTLLFAATVASPPALAYDLAKARSVEPQLSWSTKATIYEVERCIMALDLPDAPAIYRAPDKPDESLMYWPVAFHTPMVIEIFRREDTTKVEVKNPPKNIADRIATCALR